MGWVIFVAGAVLSWGAYGALLFEGQTQLGNLALLATLKRVKGRPPRLFLQPA